MNTDSSAENFKRVLLTGAASGIGKACAQQLANRGVSVYALDLVEPDVPVDNFHTLDLGNVDSIETVINVVSEAGPFDALLNVAGVPPRSGQQVQVLTINWLGQKLLTKGLLGSLRGGGAIVNMASKAGGRWQESLNEVRGVLAMNTAAEIEDFVTSSGMDATRAYNLSKEAMIVWTMASTANLRAKDLRMNSVSPAAVDTAILDDFKTAFGPMVEKNLARVGRPGEPEEIAEVAIFFASPQSRWLHGVDIAVDGGMGAMIQSEMLELNTVNLWD